MIRRNINRLIKSLVLFFLFFAQTLYADISFSNDNTMYYVTPQNNYRIEDLYIQNNKYYLKVKDKWLIFDDTTLIGELDYASLVVTRNGLIGVKKNTYTLLSNNLKSLQDNLIWATINDYGVVIKDKNDRILTIYTNGTEKKLKGYDYAEIASNNFYIAWNVIKLVPQWFLLNTDGSVIESSNTKIIEFDGKFFIKKDNKIIVIDNYKKKFIDEKYTDFMDGKEYIFLFNNSTKRWEVHDSELNCVLEVPLSNIFASIVWHNILLMHDRQKNILEMYKIDTNTSEKIDEYRIGEEYLFVKHENYWKRIY